MVLARNQVLPMLSLLSTLGSSWTQDYGSLPEEIARFVVDNGYKYVTIIPNGYPELARNLWEELGQTKEGIQSRMVNDTVMVDSFRFELDFVVIFDELVNGTLLKRNLGLIAKVKIKFALLVVPRVMDNDAEWDIFRSEMKDFQRNSYFYMVSMPGSQPGNGSYFKYVISLNRQGQFATDFVSFYDETRFVREKFNLQGLNIRSIALSWAPYMSLDGCDPEGKNCQSSGFLIDYTRLIGKMFNFTVESLKDKDNNWGVRPISGPFNCSGVWGGVMGGVVNGDYEISLSQWVWNIERNSLMDFVITSSNRLQLALTPQPAEVDTGLFLRPFTEESWIAIIVVTVVVIIAVLTPYFIWDYFEFTTGYMMISTTGWYFFVLLNAYYGGALTMFFTSEISIPFRTIRDVMEAYPDYKLLMMNGNDVHFQYKALAGDPDYGIFWNRVVNQRSETVVESVEEGLRRIKSERAVLHVFAGMLRGYIRENPFHQQPLKIFAQQKPEFQSIIFPSNSPLKAVFQLGALLLRESGTEVKLLSKWEGPEISSSYGVDKMVLEPGQVILVYIIMGGAILFSIITLLMEVVVKKVKSKNLELLVNDKDIVKNMLKAYSPIGYTRKSPTGKFRVSHQ